MLLLIDENKSYKILDVTEPEYQRVLVILGKYSVEDAENLTLLFKHTPYFIMYIGSNDLKFKNLEEVVHESDTVEHMAYRMIKCKKMYIVNECQIIMHGQEISMLNTPVANVELGSVADAGLRKYFINEILNTL